MFTRILTARERKLIQSYLTKDGERDSAVRQLAYRARRDLKTIRSDTELLVMFLRAYDERHATR
jgi:hypothetical protein